MDEYRVYIIVEHWGNVDEEDVDPELYEEMDAYLVDTCSSLEEALDKMETLIPIERRRWT